MSKKSRIIIVTILCIALIACALYVLGVFKSKEARIIDKICGTYNITELMYQTDSVLISTTFDFAQKQQLKKKVEIDKNSFSVTNKETNEICINKSNIKYTIKEVDIDFLSNGIRSQGKTLRNGLIPLENDLKKLKHKYAIFIETPATPNQIPPQSDRYVIYYLDDKLYLFNGFDMLRLETTSLNDIYSKDYPMSSKAIIYSSQAEQQDEDLSFQILDIDGAPLANAWAVMDDGYLKISNNNGLIIVGTNEIPYKLNDRLLSFKVSIFHFNGKEEIDKISFKYQTGVSFYQIKTNFKSLKHEFEEGKPRIEVLVLNSNNKPVENVFVNLDGKTPPISDNDAKYKDIDHLFNSFTDDNGKIYAPYLGKGKYQIGVYTDDNGMEGEKFTPYINEMKEVTKITVKLEY